MGKTKINHFVPQFLIKYFSDEEGKYWVNTEKSVSNKNTRKIFSQLRLWKQDIENQLSSEESKISVVMNKYIQELKPQNFVGMAKLFIPEWNMQVLNFKDNKSEYDLLHNFLIKQQIKLLPNSDEILKLDTMLTSNSWNITILNYSLSEHLKLPAFVLTDNIPKMNFFPNPDGSHVLFFSFPIAPYTMVIFSNTKEQCDYFRMRYRYPHLYNLEAVASPDDGNQRIAKFVCNSEEYANMLIEEINSRKKEANKGISIKSNKVYPR
ncbi:DUF4238 domain-containing protein [Lactococcus lactis]|uniref:DUF4238 domain-containing protein n=1 Tax=Lactococcus lactis TaxID=1358 RepID=UPI0024169915|nr:DUF4238 domain-containing protein [Lactococcus lactis]MDG4956892.1 DUF4238 domain-containing protein [Lactococcus lactis]